MITEATAEAVSRVYGQWRTAGYLLDELRQEDTWPSWDDLPGDWQFWFIYILEPEITRQQTLARLVKEDKWVH